MNGHVWYCKIRWSYNKVAEEAVEEVYEDPMMAVATKKGNSVKIAEYETLWINNRLNRICKIFYTYEDGKYWRTTIFETAMGVVKGLMHGKTGNIKQLLDLDVRYGSPISWSGFISKIAQVKDC